MSELELPLFESLDKKDPEASAKLSKKNKGWYVLTNKMNLLSIIASCGIKGRDGYEKDVPELFKKAKNRIPIFHGAVDDSLCEYISGGNELLFPVLIEVDHQYFGKGKFPVINKKNKMTMGTFNSSKNIQCIFVCGFIPMEGIKKIHFRVEMEQRDFISRAFDNVPIDLFSLIVSPELFSDTNFFDSLKFETALNSIDEAKISSELLNRVDSIAGLFAMMFVCLPPLIEFVNSAKEILEGQETGRKKRKSHDVKDIPWLAISLTGLLDENYKFGQSTLEADILRSASLEMINARPSEGWVAKNIKTKIIDSLKPHVGKKQFKEINKWGDVCEDILDNRRDVTPLGDEQNIVMRGLLLLLLRAEPLDIESSQGSAINPGDKVRFLAAILSGARYGLARLPNKLKIKSCRYLSGLMALIINDRIDDENRIKGKKPNELILKVKKTGGMGKQVSILSGSDIVLDVYIEGDPVLLKAKLIAGESDLKLEYDEENNRLFWHKEFDDGRKQDVFVNKTGNINASPMIRIWSPCLDLSSAKGRKYFNQKLAENLLKQQNDPNFSCRYSIDTESKQLRVLADQIAETNDRKEMESHLENVAKAADDFEKSIGEDRY
jgi:hypothetical protein